ncbi:MAG: site-specific DNA-methyltransferase [Candidatus Micrarchaeota archaeon]|nr:site-specific DNA-methyltransferase [Candidatus Micrarchaeota archaeon]
MADIPKEYYLQYACKTPEQDILADTRSVPFQPVKVFPENTKFKEGEWQNMLIFGDNLQALKHLLKLKKEGKLKNPDGSDGIKLVYIDPPFATEEDFQGSQDQKAYYDKLKGSEFIEFIRKRLILIKELLSDDGSIFVHLDWKKDHYIKIILDEIFGENNFHNEIIWEYQGSWVEPKNYFPRRHNMIHFYSKNQNYFFKRDYENDINAGINFNRWYDFIENNKIYARNAPYHDQRFKTYVDNFKKEFGRTPKENDIIIDFKGSVIGDVWYIKVADPKSPEKIDYPTQKPEKLIERIIRACSVKNDIILDCFAGSGTTGAVAEKLGRKWIMCDVGKLSIFTITKRMLNLKEEIGNKGNTLKPTAFVLYNAGLYVYNLIDKMCEEDYK